MNKLKRYFCYCYPNAVVSHRELDFAIQRDESAEIVKQWLQRVKNINAALPESKTTPLHLAIRKRNRSVAKLLLDNGADTEQRNSGNSTPLILACSTGYLDGTKLLVEYGADLNVCTVQGLTCLHLAAKNRHLSVVSYLLEKVSSPVNKPVEDACTLLHYVVLLNDERTTANLISKGADINAKNHKGETPVILATKHNCAESLKVMLKSRTDTNTSAQESGSNSNEAEINNHKERSELLMNNEMERDQIQRDESWTPLMCACANGCLDVVKLLVQDGADIGARTTDGSTCLLLAAKNKHTEIVSHLLEQDSCSVNIKAQDSRSAMHYITLINDSATTKLLINKGADVNARNKDGETPVFLATEHNCIESLIALLEAGADPNIKTNIGEFPLNKAVNEGQVEAVMALLSHGADRTITAKLGRSPIDFALSVAIYKRVDVVFQNLVNKVKEKESSDALETLDEACSIISNVADIVKTVLGG